MDDELILSLFERREDAALSAVAAKYGRLCSRVARNILADDRDAEECVNDTWLHAWNAIPPEKPHRLSVWLARLTRNLAVSRLRGLHSLKRGGGELPLVLDELSECIPGGADPQRELEGRELAERINAFLAGLRAEERDLFLARYYFAAPTAELAERTGLSPGRINTVLSRTRKKLERCLKEEALC
ncbi:MAG: sigma-70 family RNA polymerase sigma factor [Oscillospiraceae bacterium]|nr:sigma-70 family RNA polymerase sigma factor [Oscillospiraceae bacterium]